MVATPPAPAHPVATAAYVYFDRSRGAAATKFERGLVWVVFRTTSPMPADVGIRVGRRLAYAFEISKERNCYGARADVFHGDRLKVGDSVRVRIGAHALNQVLTVQRRRPGYPDGTAIGCGPPPVWTTIPTLGLPTQKPSALFFSADAGPYVDHLTWWHWGRSTAVARGLYGDSCADCSKLRVPARYVLRRPRVSAADGRTYYTRACLYLRRDGRWDGCH